MPPQMSLQQTQVEHQPTEADRAHFLQSIKDLAQEYEENLQKRKVDLGFNLFAIISDRYHQENLHSDILKAVIDPNGKHEEQNKYLELFLKFIISHGATIDLSHYLKAEVEREEGRIDILIKGSKHAIIVENKITNARDQPTQLPGYLKVVEEKYKYNCDAIIYLRLNGDGGPEMKEWQNDKWKHRVESLLNVICVYDENAPDKDLFNGWILKCRDVSKANSDAQFILRQYGELITKLGENIINERIMQKFYETIIKDGNFETALSFKEMLDDLSKYRAQRIIDIFRSNPAPFKNLKRSDNGALFYNPSFGGAGLEMAVWALPWNPGEKYVYLFEMYDKKDTTGVDVGAMLKKMGCLDEYSPFNDGHFRFNKEFEFPSQEKDLIRHITDFKEQLNRLNPAPPG